MSYFSSINIDDFTYQDAMRIIKNVYKNDGGFQDFFIRDLLSICSFPANYLEDHAKVDEELDSLDYYMKDKDYCHTGLVENFRYPPSRRTILYNLKLLGYKLDSNGVYVIESRFFDSEISRLCQLSATNRKSLLPDILSRRCLGSSTREIYIPFNGIFRVSFTKDRSLSIFSIRNGCYRYTSNPFWRRKW